MIKKQQKIDFTENESDSAACHAGIGASLCEKRTLVIIENNVEKEIETCSSLRLPAVFINFSRRRVGGCALQFFPENNQELIDCIIMAFRIAEDKKVMLPAIINFDNFGMRESVQIPTQQSVDKFIPKIKINQKIGKDAVYIVNQKNLHEQSAALNQSAVIIKKTAELFWQKFRRKFGFYETYMADDAEHLLITTGVNTINSRRVITTLRTQGNKIGLIKLKILRPFPDELQKFIGGKNVAVLDVNIQQGLSGTVYNEMRLIDNKLGLNFILQNRVLREKDFEEIFKKLTSRTGGIYWL